MSDIILRKLRAQVTIAMDATLRRAAFEIMSIFENTLSDHKRELAEKEEVVAQLKLKLQVAELRLKDLQVEGPSIAVVKQTQAIPEIVPDVPIEAPVEKEIIPAPEIDFEVPDDWCAPLGAELVPKQEEAICPSVRLREFSIPLCHVPIIKKESEEHFVSPQDHFVKPQTTSGSRRSSRRLAAASEMPKPVQGGVLRGKGSRMQNEIRLLFKQLNQEDFIDLTRPGLRKSRRLEEGEKKKKPFHCTKCSKRFRRPQTLKKHQERKHKKKGKAADAKEDLRWTQPLEDVEDTINDVTSQGQDSRQNTRPERVGKKRRRAENLRCQNFGVQTKERYVCSVCQKVKKSKFSLVEHYRIHTGEKPYSCGLCSLNFRFKSQLHYHDKMHHKSESQ